MKGLEIKKTQASRRICFVGALVGRNPGYVTTQGEFLADFFDREGYSVVSTSSLINRYLRLIDIVITLIKLRKRYDIIILDVYGDKSFVTEDFASFIGKLLGKKIIMHLHNGTLPDFIKRFPRWSKSVLNRADSFVAPSEYLVRAFNSIGFDVDEIPNVLDISLYPFKLREKIAPKLFWMRSFHRYYNPQMALRVLSKLKNEFPAASLVMAGKDKGDEPKIKQMATDLGLRESIIFPGFLDMEGKTEEGAKADIFLNTNTVDNMPVGIIEAWAMGLPVTATNVGGIPDMLIDGENGLLVPENDCDAMVSSISKLINHSALTKKLSSQGRKSAERCSWESVHPRWIHHLDGVFPS